MEVSEVAFSDCPASGEASQTLIVLWLAAKAKRSPFGLKATHNSPPFKVIISCPETTSHSFIILLFCEPLPSPAETRRLPSRLKATRVTF